MRMKKMSKELISGFIIDYFNSDGSIAEYIGKQVSGEMIVITFSVKGMIMETEKAEFTGIVCISDEGYTILSGLCSAAPKSAIGEQRRFIEELNNCLFLGDVSIDYGRDVVCYRTYERYWDNHEFNAETFELEIDMHMRAHKYYKEPIFLLAKGESSASEQMRLLREQDVIADPILCF